MDVCTVRWRPSGGRGEWEFVPATSLVNRRILVELPHIGITLDSEVIGTISQDKPRLRKLDSNNRSKLHLVPLIMAAARLPEPAREDKGLAVSWPLENKRFLISHVELEIVAGTSDTITVRPLVARILHSERTISFDERFKHLAEDLAVADSSERPWSEAVVAHLNALRTQSAGKLIRELADTALEATAGSAGNANAISPALAETLPPSPWEEEADPTDVDAGERSTDDEQPKVTLSGIEGRTLTRLHSYKERDRKLVAQAKSQFIETYGKLFCECCGFVPGDFYGRRGETRIEAHHRTPIEELLPDSVTTSDDLAMVCPSCHSVIHASRPWITPEQLKALLVERGSI